MKTVQRRSLIALVVLITLSLLFFQEGYHLWFLGDKYGKAYNSFRKKNGQPLIEEYFVEDPMRNKQSRSWSVRNGEGPHFHVGKFSYFDLLGSLIYEIDYYEPVIDSLWLNREIEEMETSPPIKGLKCESVQLSRTYYPKSNMITYELDLDFGNGLLFNHPISKTQGDSIFSLVK
jgi:hypothetical protein